MFLLHLFGRTKVLRQAWVTENHHPFHRFPFPVRMKSQLQERREMAEITLQAVTAQTVESEWRPEVSRE